MRRYRGSKKHVLIAVDPGARKIGWAMFLVTPDVPGGTLIAAGTSSSACDRDAHLDLGRILCAYLPHGVPRIYVREKMVVYPGQKGRSTDLKRVEDTAKRFANHFGFKWRKSVTARDWKGAVPKPVHHRRVQKHLKDGEARLWKGLGHDAKDAIGIGLYFLGRTGRGGTSPS